MRRLGIFEGGMLDPASPHPAQARTMRSLDGADCPSAATLRHPHNWIGMRSPPHEPAAASKLEVVAMTPVPTPAAPRMAGTRARQARVAGLCQAAVAVTLATASASSLFYWERNAGGPQHAGRVDVDLAEAQSPKAAAAPVAAASAPTSEAAPLASPVPAASERDARAAERAPEPAPEPLPESAPAPQLAAQDAPMPAADPIAQPPAAAPAQMVASASPAPALPPPPAAEPAPAPLEAVQDPPSASPAVAATAPAESPVANPAPRSVGVTADDASATAPRAGEVAPAPMPLANPARMMNVTAMTRLPELPDDAVAPEAPRHRAAHANRAAAPSAGRAEGHTHPALRAAPVLPPLPSWLTAERSAPVIHRARIMSAPFHTLSLPPQVPESAPKPAPQPAARIASAPEPSDEVDEPAPSPAPPAYPRPRWYGGPAYRPYQPYGYRGYGYPPGYGGGPYGNPYGGYYGGRPGYYPPQAPNYVTMD